MHILKTERLTLRPFMEEDWMDLYDYLSQSDVVKYEPYGVFDEMSCRKEAIRRSHDNAFWAVSLKDHNKVIGNIYFSKVDLDQYGTFEIGYVFNSFYQGNGYATEACKCILQYGFEALEVHRVVARCDIKNEPSWRLMERLSMRREGHYKKPAYFGTDEEKSILWHDAYEYVMLEEEWAF